MGFAVGLVAGVALVGAGAWLVARLRRRSQRNLLGVRLERFLGADPAALTLVGRRYAALELPNLHRAVESWCTRNKARFELVGYQSQQPMNQSLRALTDRSAYLGATTCGVGYDDVDVGFGEPRRCPTSAVYLVTAAESRAVVHIYADQFGRGLFLEVMAVPGDAGQVMFDELRQLAVQDNIYRGRVISFECQGDQYGRSGQAGLRFHRLAPVATEAVILPPETKALLLRNTVGFFAHAEQLRRVGQSAKRGLLLYGPPGTGKTFTAMWLATQLDGATVFLVSAEQLGAIKAVCQMARLLAPSLVILEDVDLIAAPREAQRSPGDQVTLHQLLNEMDGIEPDVEILFLLTTNRPEAIEPAVASRPGRIDQAIEYPLPDEAGRRALLELYGRGLQLELAEPDVLIARLAGASPAFIKELLRKAAQFALDRADGETTPLVVRDADLDAGLRELVLGAGGYSRHLLGFPELAS
ncbi:MAG: 26S protease regulatory subunit [Armatimonadetes bacterium]|nr:26S protease regulatory subunit [Armatimonadota bacterium]